MAEGGSDSPIDDPDAPNVLVQYQTMEEDVGVQATVLLQHFIVERFQRDGFADAPQLEELREGSVVPQGQDVVWHEVGSLLRDIGDTLDRDRELQRMIDSVPTDAPINAIMAVAHVIFRDGEISWGRIVGLFYFAYRMCARAFDSILRRSFPEWINRLIKEVVKFLVIKFAHWIVNRGGWLAVREYFGSPTWIWSTLLSVSVGFMLLSLYQLRK